ncbi:MULTISPECIES: hypothetical protein [Nostoc]|uniref:Uncharacterized protein n=2 Tax=Nostoc TaxID=1177 RepID=A0ABR8I627_9NOSO|nr:MULTISPECIES: hypothetical protein [Nostoc]MBD2561404.1 hypothetical protein [Nostoc linckia FACHB-391]MBD2646543.1 hypothetical protein [Nostoc foliaceum FACHB-393]
MNRKLAERSLFQTKRVLKPKGIITPETIMYRALTAFISSQKVKFVFEQPNPEDLVFLKELIESGKIHVVINCTYTLV